MPKTDDLAALIENTAELGWLADAACGQLGLEQLALFFVDAGRTISAEAEAMCAGCGARRACLDHAYDNEIAGGYFGGISPSRRRALSHADAVALIERPLPTAGPARTA